jgi:hypothetical protein
MIKTDNDDINLDEVDSEKENYISDNKSIMEETPFESDGFTIITTKRQRKTTKRHSLSGKAPKRKSKNKSKGDPYTNIRRDGESQGDLDISKHIPHKKENNKK